MSVGRAGEMLRGVVGLPAFGSCCRGRTGSSAAVGVSREPLRVRLPRRPADRLTGQREARGVMAAAGGVAADAGAGRVVQLELGACGVGLGEVLANNYVLAEDVE